jgi:hypothetical protein
MDRNAISKLPFVALLNLIGNGTENRGQTPLPVKRRLLATNKKWRSRSPSLLIQMPVKLH